MYGLGACDMKELTVILTVLRAFNCSGVGGVNYFLGGGRRRSLPKGSKAVVKAGLADWDVMIAEPHREAFLSRWGFWVSPV
jgi:hypothetical protein